MFAEALSNRGAQYGRELGELSLEFVRLSREEAAIQARKEEIESRVEAIEAVMVEIDRTRRDWETESAILAADGKAEAEERGRT
jgi:hypothetical protein